MDIPSEILEVFEVRLIGNLGTQPVDVKAGDTLVFTCDIRTRSGLIYGIGELLRVIESTQSIPYNELGSAGYNWVCETRHGRSVWATLEQCVSRGIFKRVTNPTSPE